MGWQLDSEESRAFSRNLLRLVVVQMRFHPILRIGQGGSSIAEFQERVRSSFPVFEERQARTVNFEGLTGSVAVSETLQSLFRESSGPTIISLQQESLGIETTRYVHHREFFQAVETALDALEVFAPIKPQRLGMRYVNVIPKPVVERDLGRLVEWEDLVARDAFPHPAALEIDGSTQFRGEVRAAREPGAMTLRLGMKGEAGPEDPSFTVDLDRYVESEYPLEDTMSLLNRFVEDAYNLFVSVIGEATREWLETGEEVENAR